MEKKDKFGWYEYEGIIEVKKCNLDPEYYKQKEKDVEVHVKYLIFFRERKEIQREIRNLNCPYLKYISYGSSYCTRCKNCTNDIPTCIYDKDIRKIKNNLFDLHPENHERI